MSTPELQLPGFRFHPTEDELLNFYLKNIVSGKNPQQCDVIGVVNIYRHDPWELPGLSRNGEREWYFFVPRDRRHNNGGRPNRTTEHGYWKATGSDRKIVSLSEPKRIIGLRKTLVFYTGRAPRGLKTDWVMNEYRLPDNCPLPKDIVLCKIYRKATSLKVLEKRAAMEEEMKTNQLSSSPLSFGSEAVTFCSGQPGDFIVEPADNLPSMVLKEEELETIKVEEYIVDYENSKEEGRGCSASLQFPFGKINLPEIQVPNKMNDMDWSLQDGFYSPYWLQNWTQAMTPSANILNL